MYMFLLNFFLLSCIVLSAAPGIGVYPADTHDFGKFPANEEQTYRFQVTNTGDTLLKITQIRHTCGCSSGGVDKELLSPGETTSLTIKILKESIAGPFNKVLFLQSDAVNAPYKMITLSGESLPLVTVSPQKLLYIGTVEASKEFKQDFILQTKQAVTYGPPQIKSNVSQKWEMKKIGENKTLLSVSICPQKKGMSFNCAVSIPITSPSNWKDVMIEIEGRTQR